MDYFQRILFGASKLITDNTTSGDEYGTIKKIITIHIVYFDLGQGTDYIYKGETIFEGIHDKSILGLNTVQKEMFSANKVSEIFPQHYVIRIDNFKDEVATTLDEWIYFFKNSAIEDTFKAKGINLANEKLSLLKLDEKDRKQYDFYMEDVSFNKSVFRTAKVDGYYEGREEGRAEGRAEGIEAGRLDEKRYTVPQLVDIVR